MTSAELKWATEGRLNKQWKLFEESERKIFIKETIQRKKDKNFDGINHTPVLYKNPIGYDNVSV